MDACIVEVILRYNGYWKLIPRTGRHKYECGNQKTVRVDVNEVTLRSFGQQITQFLLVARGYLLNLSYTIPNTNPRLFGSIKTNLEFIQVLREHLHRKKIEMFLVLDEENRREGGRGVDDERFVSWNDILVEDMEGHHVCNDVISYGTEDEWRGHEIWCENEDRAEDDADEIYSEDGYHSFHSSESADSGCSDIESSEGPIYLNDLEHPEITLGQKFKDVAEFRLYLRQYSIKSNFNYKTQKNDSVRFVACCVEENCPWRVRAKRLSDGKSMEISKIGGNHTCVGVNKCLNTQANSNWIAQAILREVKANPNISPREIINTIHNKYQLKLAYHMAWSGIEKARESIFGNVDKSYDYAESLRLELVRRNPGSHIDLMVDSDTSFWRLFVCFKACIDGFRLGCRPLIGLDGCHLRAKYLGMLLSAVALDGNNGLFPIAFAVVEGESGDTWHWFVKNLQTTFQGDLSGVSFISDQEKGLQESLSILLPENEHRVCLRHLWKAFKKNFSGDFFEQTVWDAARSYTSFEFDMHMARLKGVSEPAWKYLKERR